MHLYVAGISIHLHLRYIYIYRESLSVFLIDGVTKAGSVYLVF